MMKSIVTGSMGFIGKALCRKLEESGVEVVGIDRKCGIEASDIGSYMEGADVVYHLAAQTSVFNNDLVQIRKDNIDTFMEVAKACRESGVKLVYASSSTARGVNTTSMYGMSKAFNEQFASVYCPYSTGVRLHNVYGPDPREGTLLWNLMNLEHVTIYNNGMNIRSFTWIDDILDCLMYAAFCNMKLINAVNPTPCTVRSFTETVRKYKDVDVQYVPNRRCLDNPAQTVDAEVFSVPLSYTPVETGIRKVFNG